MLAKVVQPNKLKAQLKIAETQAKDIAIGQPASIDTRNGVVEGNVSRVDPSSQNGTVTVDVAMDGELPQGARPDLSVDGTIELDRLKDVKLRRPPGLRPGEEPRRPLPGERGRGRGDAREGQARQELGEVKRDLRGIEPGDLVILSDMSAWDGDQGFD